MPQMEALLRHTRQQAASLAEGLYGGDTSIRPMQTGSTVSCEYCDYKGVCGFDPEARGAQARELPEMSLDELRQRLDGTFNESGAGPDADSQEDI